MGKIAETLKPRKSPVQARSVATVNALYTATIQILTQKGLSHCTTTRVAKRAGMSVGSLYQYYPNRDALLAAVLRKHLDGVSTAVEDVCRSHRHKPVAEMASALTAAVLTAKLRVPQESKALYAVAGERGGAELVANTHARIVAAIAAMLSSAPDAHFDDPATTATIAFNALAGPIRAWLEGHAPVDFETHLEGHLVQLLTAYLQTHQPGAPRG